MTTPSLITDEHAEFERNPESFIEKLYVHHSSKQRLRFQMKWVLGIKEYRYLLAQWHTIDNPAGHKLSWCSHCTVPMIMCAKCNNNTCNGGYGKVGNEECDLCKTAYDLHDILRKIA